MNDSENGILTDTHANLEVALFDDFANTTRELKPDTQATRAHIEQVTRRRLKWRKAAERSLVTRNALSSLARQASILGDPRHLSRN